MTGKGGHASTPYLANDPMPVAAEIVQALQVMVTRRISTFDPVVITITKIRAGTTSNVIPEAVHMHGHAARGVRGRARGSRSQGIERVAANDRRRARDDARPSTVEPGYPVTVNDDDFADFALDVATDLLGRKRVGRMPTPVMGAEDFSYVLQQRPGALAFVGVCPPGEQPARAHACHSNRMMIDEDGMQAGIAMHAAVALSYLDRRATDEAESGSE